MKQHLEYSVKSQFLKHEEVALLISEFNIAFKELDALKITENVVNGNRYL
jgi:hypothetical protein